jgi:hypothetical protein
MSNSANFVSITLHDAASQLDVELRKSPWYLSVGEGQTENGDTIFVYVKSSKHRKLKTLETGWLGYPVLIRQVGSIRAIKSNALVIGAYLP